MEPVIFYALLFIVSVSPILIISLVLWKKSKCVHIGKTFWICLGIQFAVYIALLRALPLILEGDTSGGMIGVVVIPALFGITGLIGLMSYPLVYILVNRSEGWKSSVGAILVFYLIVISVLTATPAIRVIEKKYNKEIISEENFSFYGKLVDINQIPIHGAVLEHMPCRWASGNPSISDSNGIFHIRAHCGGKMPFRIWSIHDGEGAVCNIVYDDREYPVDGESHILISRWRDDNIVINIEGKPYVNYEEMSWEENSARSPVEFVCKTQKKENDKSNKANKRILELNKPAKKIVKVPEFTKLGYGVIDTFFDNQLMNYKISEPNNIIKKKDQKLGIEFGVFVSLSEAPILENRSDIAFTIHYPKPGLTNPSTGETKIMDSKIAYQITKTQWILSMTFKEQWQIQSGQWLFQLKYKDTILIKQYFIVE